MVLTTNRWTSRASRWSRCSLCADVEVLRDSEGLKKLDRIPPVLRRAASLTDCVLVSGVGGAGDFAVLVRRTDGLAGVVDAFGSRTEALLLSH